MTPVGLEDSLQHCEKITRERARNFYYGIRLLPELRRRGLCAVYAFFRYCDDVSDDEETRDPGRLLAEWRAAVDPTGDGPRSNPILPAFHDTVMRFGIPLKYFYELIDGAEADLSVNRYHKFDDLYRYCYQVASTVGLVCIHIFGFDGTAAALEQAEQRGIAFQMTNILRDVAEDAGRGRIYLPLEDLTRFGVSSEALLACKPEAGFAELIAFEVERARDYYERSTPLVDRVERESRASLEAMTGIYRALLEKVSQMGPAVLKRRAKLSKTEKVKLAGQVLMSSLKR